jgi:hypothetical protein
MPLNIVVSGNTVLASDVNQVVQVLQRQSGQSETGKYYLLGSGYAVNANLGSYTVSLSRTTVPVSVVIDEADQAHTNTNAAAAATLQTANGFLVSVSASGAATNVRAGGNYTINY